MASLPIKYCLSQNFLLSQHHNILEKIIYAKFYIGNLFCKYTIFAETKIRVLIIFLILQFGTNNKLSQKLTKEKKLTSKTYVFCRYCWNFVLFYSIPRISKKHQHPSIGSNHVNRMLDQKPACLTKTPISAQQNSHVRSLQDSL